MVQGLLVTLGALAVPLIGASIITGALYIKGKILLGLIPLILGGILLLGCLIATAPLYFSVRGARLAGYALREHDIAYRHGVIFRKTVLLPLNRLQHAEVSSGPLQRRYGLASLKLYTAGASGVDLQIDGLTAERATELRDYGTGRIEDPR